MEINNFTFCPFLVDISEEAMILIHREVLSLSEEHWHFNTFRNCNMLSIYNPGGVLGQVSLRKKGDYQFTAIIEKCPNLKSFIEERVFNWMVPRGRITILRTRPQVEMKVHLDCSLQEVGTPQFKWRFVISGEVDKLYFLDANGEKVYISSKYRCYVLDGSHPHSVDVSHFEKLTLCIGSPWKGSLVEGLYKNHLDFENALQVSRPKTRSAWIDPILLHENLR